MTEDSRLRWLHIARNLQEMEDRYNQWAPEYDADSENDFAYSGPQTATSLLSRHVPLGAKFWTPEPVPDSWAGAWPILGTPI